MAVCDANYKFSYVDIGAYGREGDRNVFATSDLAAELKNGKLGLPGPEVLPFSDKILPHYFNGDEAFPLLPNLMKPLAGRNTGRLDIASRIFNYRFIKLCCINFYLSIFY